MPGSTEIRKLITGFLALAILVSGLIFAGTNAPALPSAEPEKPAPVLRNAFLEVPGYESPEPVTNLTVVAAENLGRNLIEANPLGPQDIRGTLTLQSPSLLAMTTPLYDDPEIELAVALARAELLKDELDPARVSVLKSAGTDELREYLSSIEHILNQQTFDPEVMKIFEKDLTSESVNSLGVLLAQSLSELERLSVPAELLDFHLATHRFLTRLQKMAVFEPDNGDPLRALLVYEIRTEATRESLQQVRAGLSRIEKISANLPPSSSSRLSGFVPTAHAQWVVIDPAMLGINIAKHSETIIQKIYKYLTEMLKDRLVHKLVEQTITWIQGGGKPQFITNWKGFLKGVANEEAGRMIEEVAPRLCQSFGPMVRVALLPVEIAPSEAVSCTLDQVVSNVQDFYNDFTQGGWIAFGGIVEPSNNIFGALIESSALVGRKSAERLKAEEKEAEAGRGFLPTKQCVRKDTRSEFEKCVADFVASCPPIGALGMAGCQAAALSRCQGQPRTPGTKCLEWKTTTPGDLLAGITHDSMNAPLQRIVNAEDLAALVNALINAGLTKLVKAGQKGLLGVDARASNDSSFREMCAGLKGEAYQRCKKATQQACADLPPDMKTQCESSLAEEAACLPGEIAMESGNASGVDPSGTPGWYCDADPFSLEETTVVRLSCLPGQGTGAAFITRNRTSCNDRSDEQGSSRWMVDIGPGWTTDGNGNWTDIFGEPVEFESVFPCADGESIYVTLSPGSYQAGGYTATPSTGATVCAMPEGGGTVPPPGTSPGNPSLTSNYGSFVSRRWSELGMDSRQESALRDGGRSAVTQLHADFTVLVARELKDQGRSVGLERFYRQDPDVPYPSGHPELPRISNDILVVIENSVEWSVDIIAGKPGTDWTQGIPAWIVNGQGSDGFIEPFGWDIVNDGPFG